jgi:hypothetical protein
VKTITIKLLFGIPLLCLLPFSPSLTQVRQSKLPTIPLTVKAVLVNTVESGATTPVIGVTQDDVWWHGKIIVPRGSTIHGLSLPASLRDRIGCNRQFVIAYPNGGPELRVQGIVLDRDDADANRGIWGITDGSYGLKGEMVNAAFVRVVAGHRFYLYVQKVVSQS